jgi:DNA-binding IclR family transcriptional regulator
VAKDSYIGLVGKIVTLFEILRDSPEGLHLQELTRRTGNVKSSIHRILQSLKRHGYIEQKTPGGPYRLGLEVLVLAQGVKQGRNFPQMGRDYLIRLREAFGETTYLAMLRKERAFFIEVLEPPRNLRLVNSLGNDVHFHATAAGKAIAAFLPAERLASLLKTLPLERLTKKTITDRVNLEKEWAKIRQRGYAINDEESIVGAVFLAVPVFDAHHRVCGSMGIGVPKPRYTAKLSGKMILRLKDACQQFSKVLEMAGYIHEDDV